MAATSSTTPVSPFPAGLLLGGFPRFQLNTSSPNTAFANTPTQTPIAGGKSTPNGPPVSAGGVFPGLPTSGGPQAGMPPFFAGGPNPWLFVQQLMKQYAANAAASPAATPAHSGLFAAADSASISSTAASPSINKKLQLDADGNFACPICEEKIGAEQWTAHVQKEKQNLKKLIEDLNETRRSSTANGAAFNAESLVETRGQAERKKREFELQRVRANQEKRLRTKGALFSSSSIGGLPTPLGAGAKFAFGSMAAAFPDDLRSSRSGSRDADAADRNLCKSCERPQEFLVISAGLDEPRCMDCYRKYRRQVGALPLTITGSPLDENRAGSNTTSNTSPRGAPDSLHDDEDYVHLNGDDCDAPTAKRPKVEFGV
ncbi:hypothetical protein M3Y99_00943700 [Aphelenchoides fujianensis]|nr:hypothetical protein M3Y99_00943700 [Aphelenchoides fujianensis]